MATTPYKQIRARLPAAETIVVFQAYSSAIALPAVERQKLDASPEYLTTRMTWIKPSFYWCMYRSGWSFKDKRQERILSITMSREGFLSLLTNAVLSGDQTSERAPVRVQWDPERDIHLERLPYRSIQIGIGGSATATNLMRKWLDEWIIKIDDITEDVRKWKGMLDEGGPKTAEEVQKQIDEKMMAEEVVTLNIELKRHLGME